MAPVNIIHSLCIKIGLLNTVSKYNFLYRYFIKKKIFRLFDQFFNYTIFEQSDALASILISLNGQNPEILTDILENIVRVTPVSMELYVKNALVSYIQKGNYFSIDTNIHAAGGYKFDYKVNGSGNSNFDSMLDALLPDIEKNYMSIIYSIAMILNNPYVNEDIAVNPDIDPFVDWKRYHMLDELPHPALASSFKGEKQNE